MSSEALSTLGLLVVKQGVSLGGLSAPERQQAFAMVWAGLPAAAMTERELNQQLQAQLAAAAAFLATDHVELRRWLVDATWLQRDGFGREYRRTAAASLPAAGQALALQLAAMDIEAWVAELRAAQAARRDDRRRGWQERQHQGGTA
jgi:hypothetical protein